MAVCTCGNFTVGITLRRQHFCARQHRAADDRRYRRREGRLLGCKIFRHRPEIWIWQEFQEVVHRWVFAPSVPKRDQLIVEVPCRLACESWEVVVVGTLSFVSVAGGACQYASRHGVRCVFAILRLSDASMREDGYGK